MIDVQMKKTEHISDHWYFSLHILEIFVFIFKETSNYFLRLMILREVSMYR